MRPRKPTTRAVHESRNRRLPSPRISCAVAFTEIRRTWRVLRSQDIWLVLTGFLGLFLLASAPLAFDFARAFGLSYLSGETTLSAATGGVVVLWLTFTLFGVFSGLGSNNEIANQVSVFTARPPKDIAGGFLLAIVLVYTPLLFLPVVAAGVGFVVALGTPAPVVGFALAGFALLITGPPLGYVVGLWMKGLLRRHPTIGQFKPHIVVLLAVGYFWLSASGHLWPLVNTTADLLSASPLIWLGDLTFVTTPGADVSPIAAATIFFAALFIMPVVVFGAVRAAEYAWYVDEQPDEDDQPTEPGGQRAGEYIDYALAKVGVAPAVRGVTTVVLLRAYRRPLNLAFVGVPLLFALPAFDSVFGTAFVPQWAPWAAIVYGAWAAGVAFPLNVLGHQSATLPVLLATGTRGRTLVHGYILAATLAFTPPTLVAALGIAHIADFSLSLILLVALLTPLSIIAASALAAGLGAGFPRFQTIQITATRKALLPSKVAFMLFSAGGMLAAIAVGLVTDDRYPWHLSQALSTHLPYDMTLGPDSFSPYSELAIVALVCLVPVAYLFSVYYLNHYRLS